MGPNEIRSTRSATNANMQIGGGIKYVLNSHTHQLSSLPKLYNAAGDVCKDGAKGVLQLLHDPTNVLKK
eukprot:5486865-Ditylum_brightwellii.AAC.1